MSQLTIDLDSSPDLHFRIDNFSVPPEARAEFLATMQRNLAFIQTLPGFRGHLVFEKTGGPSTFDYATIAVWESKEAIEAAVAEVRAYYQSIGFDLQSMVSRLGINSVQGAFRAIRDAEDQASPVHVQG
jgi:quinol monooxygenase YgiN